MPRRIPGTLLPRLLNCYVGGHGFNARVLLETQKSSVARRRGGKSKRSSSLLLRGSTTVNHLRKYRTSAIPFPRAPPSGTCPLPGLRLLG